MRISKSKYVTYCQCKKALWLTGNRSELAKYDDMTVFENGNKVGDLAKGLFGAYVDVSIKDKDGRPDTSSMIKRTEEEIKKGTPVICEAAFCYDDKYYVAIDLLKKEKDGYAIYEVKSSSVKDDDKKEEEKNIVYYKDIAFQKWVLDNCKIKVVGTYLVKINKKYVLEDKIDIDQFFEKINVEDKIIEHYNDVINCHIDAYNTINLKSELNIQPSKNCFKPYNCPFMEYCIHDLPSPSVFDLYYISKEKATDYYNNGKITFESLKNEDLNEFQKLQIDCTLNNKTSIDKEGIKKFLDTLTYPLYHLDFETMSFVIPEYKGTRPMQRIPFQFSLHYQNEKDGELFHEEFLAEVGVDPREDLVKKLVEYIPDNACVLVYNSIFEKGVLKELAEDFPKYKTHLLKIRDNIKDLYEPFRSKYYYLPSMKGSFSIKSVLPALYPNDPTLNYHNLEGIQNGGDAMTVFPKLKDKSKEEQEKIREQFLKYCGLDTYAMVKVLDKLYEAIE